MTALPPHEQSRARHWAVVTLLAFVALIASVHGGWLLATAAGSLAHAIVMLVGVGGSAALAAVLALLHHPRAAQAALGAGILLLLWIVTQMVSLHRVSWREISDFVIADVLLLLATSRPAKDRAHADYAT